MRQTIGDHTFQCSFDDPATSLRDRGITVMLDICYMSEIEIQRLREYFAIAFSPSYQRFFDFRSGSSNAMCLFSAGSVLLSSTVCARNIDNVEFAGPRL